MKDATIEKGDDGIVTVTIDMQDAPLNVMNDAFGTMLEDVLEALEGQRETMRGVILTSGKSSFVAGGDVHKILDLRRAGPAAILSFVRTLKSQLARLENLGRPVVAALNGSALGGGLELALACHHRIAVDDPRAQFGFPEVGLGLLPGGGGVVRSVRMVGLMKALPLLTEGRRLGPAEAVREGLVDALASDRAAMLAAAAQWIDANPEPVQPWQRKDYVMPGGSMFDPANAGACLVFPSMLYKKTRGHLPAAERILGVALESGQVGFDAAMEIESRGFCELLMTPAAENLMQTGFVQMNEISAGASRPQGFARGKVERLGILGAGMMGRGIAYSAALAGLDVILLDTSVVAAERGKDYSRDLVGKRVERGRMSPDTRDAFLERIRTTADMADIAPCDLVIEAVFEDVAIKQHITAEAEAVLGPDAIVATNTSTLPISLLAGTATRPSHFIGLHFFSPVDKMNIVEIICGEKTDAACLARAYDFVQQIKKVPIVVRDSRGFFTSRVFSVFADEGDRLLKEGVAPILIDNVARQAGMPVGPLAVQDEVMMDMLLRSYDTNRALDAELGDAYSDTYAVCGELCQLMTKRGRPGRSAGAGFYDYAADGTKSIWPGLAEIFGGKTSLPVADLRDRMMFRMVVEAARCLAEQVVTHPRDGNVGSMLAFGFPAYTGGVFQFIVSMGRAPFEARCRELADAYGDRFVLPAGYGELLFAEAPTQRVA